MRKVALTLALFLGAAGLSIARQDQPTKLDGTYAVKAAEKDGEPLPPEELKKIVEVIIRDDIFTMKREGAEDHRAKLTLDATKRPAHVDVVPQDGPEKDKTLPGIYRMERDELTFVVAKEGGRPKDFEAKGKGIMKLILQKKKGAAR
jgi:uncharacterized protein (TIGR03067 family)